ncbi:MAG: glycosyltransferase family 39 protein [Candidatus Omnitrophota bacterium]
MLEKYRKLILLGIIVLGFALRYYAASNCSVVWDERHHDFPPAREISFNVKHLNLPLIDTRPQCSPMAGKYLVRAGWYIFGDNLLGARIPFVAIGTLNILLIYLLARVGLGTSAALLAASLFALCQFNLTTSRIADVTNPAVICMAIFSLWLFSRALRDSNDKLLLLNGVAIGIGFWFKENAVFLVPIYLIFLAVCPGSRRWLKKKQLWISFVISFLVASPLVYASLNSAATRYGYILDESTFGISLNAVGLYLGELILVIIKPLPKLFNYVAVSLDNEYTMVNFALGILILVSVVKWIRNKEPFIRMLIVCFLFNFISFSFIRRDNIILSFWNLGSLDWSCISMIPGIILAAYTLDTMQKKYKKLGVILCAALLIFMAVRAVDIAAYPLNGYFPRREYLLEKDYFLYEADDILYLGDARLSKGMLEKVYKLTGRMPMHKKAAALRLARILIKEGRYKEGKGYLEYVFSQDPGNKEALNLKEELKNKDWSINEKI